MLCHNIPGKISSAHLGVLVTSILTWNGCIQCNISLFREIILQQFAAIWWIRSTSEKVAFCWWFKPKSVHMWESHVLLFVQTSVGPHVKKPRYASGSNPNRSTCGKATFCWCFKPHSVYMWESHALLVLQIPLGLYVRKSSSAGGSNPNLSTCEKVTFCWWFKPQSVHMWESHVLLVFQTPVGLHVRKPFSAGGSNPSRSTCEKATFCWWFKPSRSTCEKVTFCWSFKPQSIHMWESHGLLAVQIPVGLHVKKLRSAGGSNTTRPICEKAKFCWWFKSQSVYMWECHVLLVFQTPPGLHVRKSRSVGGSTPSRSLAKLKYNVSLSLSLSLCVSLSVSLSVSHSLFWSLFDHLIIVFMDHWPKVISKIYKNIEKKRIKRNLNLHKLWSAKTYILSHTRNLKFIPVHVGEIMPVLRFIFVILSWLYLKVVKLQVSTAMIKLFVFSHGVPLPLLVFSGQ